MTENSVNAVARALSWLAARRDGNNAIARALSRADDKARYYMGPHAYGAASSALDTLSPVQDYQSAIEGSAALAEGVQRGDWRDSVKGGALMAAGLGAAMMPGNQRPVMAAADGSGGARRGITAYHGSPHDFDQFDISKIGTGEGAQAYGHGLYFAEREGVARAYRDKLTPTQDASNVKPDKIAQEKFGKEWGELVARQPPAPAPGTYGKNPNAFDEYQNALDAWFEETEALHKKMVDDTLARNPMPGRMYQVRIDANPEDFLDWDRPLSEQPRLVQEMARNADLSQVPTRLRRKIEAWRGEYTPPEGLTVEQPTGNELHSALTNFGTDAGNNAAVTERLKEAGIPGIRYLDQGSRAAGDGSRNYVVFDDKLITILKKYGLIPAAVTAGAALNPQDVDAAVRENWSGMTPDERRVVLESFNRIPRTAD